ncbi:MAG: hypothetical protein KIS81_09240 [Maricaulaceae bacterium]|nr:hypothetical protein [Maricaulaceae bacterium]
MSRNTAPEPSAPPQQRGFLARLTRVTPGDLVRLFFLCVIAGLVLAAFRIDPRRLWVDFFGAIREAWTEFFRIAGDLFSWAVDYFFLGAIIVIPIWIAVRLISSARKPKP